MFVWDMCVMIVDMKGYLDVRVDISVEHWKEPLLVWE